MPFNYSGMHPIYRKSVIVFFVAVLVRMAFQYIVGFTADDAFITFRYADNIAFGNGFVYNVGERVLGTTTPLFALLLSFFAVVSIPPVHSSTLVLLVSSGLTAVVLYRLAVLLRFAHFSYVPALLYILWPRSVTADTCGVETALFTFLVTCAFYYQRRQLNFYAIGLATLASLVRPEGVVVLTIILGYNCHRDRVNLARYLATPAALLIPWVVFSQLYFGSILPNAMTARLALYGRLDSGDLLQNLLLVTGWQHPAGWILTATAAVGAYWLIRKQNFGRLEILWIICMITLLTLSGMRLNFWYIVPIYPAVFLLACAVFPMLADRLSVPQYRRHNLTAGIALVLSLALAAGLYTEGRHFHGHQSQLTSVNKNVGLYLYRSADRDFDRAALEQIGYAGYYSQMRIIDREGSVSPEIVEYNRHGRYLDAILDLQPRWVGLVEGSPISGFADDSVFVALYTLEKQFTYREMEVYSLFRRAEVGKGE